MASLDVVSNVHTVDEAGNVSITPTCSYYNITNGTATIKTSPGRLIGVIVNSHTSGTIKLFDQASGAAGTAVGPIICNTITLAAGERAIDFRGLKFGTGCIGTVGGTANLTFLYN
jgi:hypothetical protein